MSRRSAQLGKPSSSELDYHGEKVALASRDMQLIKKLWSYARPYRGLFLLSLILLPIVSALSLVQPYILQLAIDDHLTTGKMAGLGLLALLFMGAVFGQFILQSAQYISMQWAGLRALYGLRVALFRHVMKLQLRFFHRVPVGRLMTRLTTDIDSMQDAIANGMVTVIADLITLAAIVVILLVKSWKLALVAFICVPLLMGLSILFRALMRRAFQIIRVKIARLHAYLQEAVGGMTIIQLFNRERLSQDEFAAINRDHRDAQFKQIRWDAMLFALVEAISSIATALIIWYGAGAAVQGVVTLGVLVAFVEYVRKFFIPIRDLSQKYALYQSAMTAAERIFGLFSENDVLPQAENPVARPTLEHRIEFRDVWFAYDEENWVLRGVSFTVERGERVGLVGRTGAGKSTIIALLTRLHDIQKGQILIDDIDVREWDVGSLRRMFAVVLQDPFLFSGDLLRNITLGDSDVADESASQAANAVHLNELLDRRGRSLSLHVAERGANLSAGEKQLVAFARALARNPQVLILDEATANVDTETEALIQDAVNVLLAGRTSVVIAHRLSTIRTVDNILVLHHGEVVEQGDHEGLIQRSGLYARLYELEYELAA